MIDDYGDDERSVTDEFRLERSVGKVKFIAAAALLAIPVFSGSRLQGDQFEPQCN